MRLRNFLVIVALTFAASCRSEEPSINEGQAYEPQPDSYYDDTAEPPQNVFGQSVLDDFLEANPAYHLPTAEELQIDPDSEDQEPIEDMRISRADTNRDGQTDVAVVLVRNGRFNVGVFHGTNARQNSRPVWVVTGSDSPIFGVIAAYGSVTPLNCPTCGTNPTYRWVGTEYEQNGRVVGDSVCLGNLAQLFNSPDPSSPAPGITHIQSAVVSEVGPRAGTSRWYRIRLVEDGSREVYALGDNFVKGLGICS